MNPTASPVHHRLEAGIIALLCTIAVLALYDWRVELSGDQNPQILAAQALVDEGRLLVPLHPTHAPAVIHPPAEQRETLFWFAPGYSVLLAGVMAATGTAAGAATAVFWGNLILGTWLWSWWARRVGFLHWQVLVALLFVGITARPSTTTDQLVTTLVGALFLLDSFPIKRPLARALAIAAILCAAIALRWAAALLTIVWCVFILLTSLRQPRHWLVIAGLPAAIALVFYVVLTRSVAPHGNLYTSGAGPATHWPLLWKALWFANAGGWSPPGFGLRVLQGVLVFAIVPAAAVWWATKRTLPRWLALLATLQLCSIIFLAWVQHAYSAMYDPLVPAFATARFYSLAKPASALALAACVGVVVRAVRNEKTATWMTWAPVSVYLAACAAAWTFQNHVDQARLQLCADGFLRPAELREFEADLRVAPPDCLIARDGYLQFSTLSNPRRYYPAGDKLVLDQPMKVGLVAHRGERSLPWEAAARTAGQLASAVGHGDYVLATYRLAPGTYPLAP